ncbi:hypothetical protein CHS0354_027617 [Potamilus streckersoni]|uniref:UMOD/GP2/OIT3-like D8C domain-containing protein n=1 Tax=Potamilus streckersoni TaxID=2493646 RepID=A0AAE0SEQ0_9BIVA|nr:hypothetical protein CHS0354_027617 [Potamilus streckersoni]
MSDRCPDCDSLSNDRSDLYDLDHDTWYGTEFNMTTRYVSPYGCGTRVPIWMNGTIPMIGEGVLSRTACVATFESLCASSYSIKVKRCDSSNTVYCLDNLPSSIQQRYCFDFDPRTFPSTSTTTAAKLPITQPPNTDGERIAAYKETGVQGWVIAVIAAQFVIILGLVAIVIVIFRQFRKNHNNYRTFPEHEMPSPYKQVNGFIPTGKEKEMTSVVNLKPKY